MNNLAYLESPSSEYRTYLGSYNQSYLMGFFYTLVFDEEFVFDDQAIKDTLAHCNGYCFSNTEASSWCECEFCVLDPGTFCLSTCLDPTLSSLCTPCDTCDGLCTVDQGCRSISFNEYPVVDFYDSSVGQQLCHSDCNGCVGPTVDDCIEECICDYCNFTDLGCQCPDNSTLDGNSCVCSFGYFMTAELGVFRCEQCIHPCASCENTATNCIQCTILNAVLENGDCHCPSTRSLVESVCECIEGYVETNELQCTVCEFPCLTCEHSPTYCTSCESSFSTLIDGQCFCPTDALITNSVCECPDQSSLHENQCICENGYYMDSSSCEPCADSCVLCEGSATFCTECVVTNALLNEGVCECPPNRVLLNNVCECEKGYFEADGVCEQCSDPCSACDSASNYCTECTLSSANLENGVCACPPNASLNEFVCECSLSHYMVVRNNMYTCEPCDITCRECTEFVCLQCQMLKANILDNVFCHCPEFAEVLDGECVCGAGRFMEQQEGEFVCVECNPECLECTEVANTCTQCKAKEAKLSKGTCECPVNSYFDIDSCVCVEGYEFADGACKKTELEVIVAAASMAAVGVFTLLVNNPVSLWNILNTMELVSYMPLHNIDIPQFLFNFCTSLDFTNVLPSILENFNGLEHLGVETAPEKFQLYEFHDKHPVILYEFPLIIGICLTVALLVALLIYKFRKFPSVAKYLSYYKYSIPVRYLLEFYLDLGVTSAVLFGSILHAGFSLSFLVGICGTALLFLFFGGLSISIATRKLAPERERGDWETLFYEFDFEKSSTSVWYYPLFVFRRLAFVGTTYFLEQYPLLQIIITSICTAVNLLFLLRWISYKGKWNHGLMVMTEVCMLLICLFFGLFLLEPEAYYSDLIAYSIIGLVGLAIGARLIFLVVMCIHKLIEYHKRRKYAKQISCKTIIRPVKVFPIVPEDLSRTNLSCFFH